MTLKTKKCIILILSCLLVLTVVFGVLINTDANKNKTYAVTASESTLSGSEYFYFGAGASVAADSIDPYRIRFFLYVYDNYISDYDSVYLTTNPWYEDSSVYFITSQTLTKSDFVYWDTDDSDQDILVTVITLSAPLHYEFSISATLNSEQVQSDTRSIYYIWEKLVENNDFEDFDPGFETIVRDNVDFSSNVISSFSASDGGATVNDVTFTLNPQPTITANGYQQLTFSLSSYVVDKLNSREYEVIDNSSFWYTRYTYRTTRYVLGLFISFDLDGYGNSSFDHNSRCYNLYTFSKLMGEELEFGSGVVYSESFFDLGVKHMAHVSESLPIYSITFPIFMLPELSRNYYLGLVEITEELEMEKFNPGHLLNFLFTSSDYTYSSEINYFVSNFSTNYLCYSTQSVVEALLARPLVESNLTDYEREYLQDLAGIAPSTEEVTVHVKYKTMDGFANIIDSEYTFLVNGIWVQNKDAVISKLMQLKGIEYLSDFNVNYIETIALQGSGVNKTYERIYLQATGFSYSYDSETEYAELVVNYADFKYKDFCIRLTNNDTANNLTVDVYTTNVTEDISTGTVTLTFDYHSIEEQMLSCAGWSFMLEPSYFSVTGAPTGIAYSVTENNIVITFDKSYENNLSQLFIKGVAPIVEDVLCFVNFDYVQLTHENGEIKENVLNKELGYLYYTKLKLLNFENLMSSDEYRECGTLITSAVTLDILNGQNYYTPVSMQRVENSSNYVGAEGVEYPFYTIVIDYDYNALFKITNNYDSTVTWKVLSDTTLLYYGSDFVSSIPEEYRVLTISVDETLLRAEQVEDYTKSTFTYLGNVKDKTIVPVEIEYTDSWNVVVNYFSRFKSTPFAEKKQLISTIKVSDYGDIYNLTNEDLKKILNVEDVSILGRVTVEKINVTFDNVSTYTIDLDYTYTTLKQIDYDGNTIEIKIPLTSYADWCNMFGQDWSILYLNMPEKTYFQYTNDVNREDLYGFFSVAIFEERVTDFNYYFKNNTGDGCMSLFVGKEVKGSDLYKFFGTLQDNVFTSISGHVGMAFCELLNEDNHISYSHFFYLDCTSNNPFISNGGADSSDDEDSALENKGQDIWNSVTTFFSDLGNSPIGKILQITGIVIVGILAVWVISFIWRIFKPKKHK